MARKWYAKYESNLSIKHRYLLLMFNEFWGMDTHCDIETGPPNQYPSLVCNWWSIKMKLMTWLTGLSHIQYWRFYAWNLYIVLTSKVYQNYNLNSTELLTHSGQHLMNATLQMIVSDVFCWMKMIMFSLVPKCPIENKSGFVQAMAWCWTGNLTLTNEDLVHWYICASLHHKMLMKQFNEISLHGNIFFHTFIE